MEKKESGNSFGIHTQLVSHTALSQLDFEFWLCYKLFEKNWVFTYKEFFPSQRRDSHDMVDSDISCFVHLVLPISGGNSLSSSNKVSILNVFINKRSDSGLHGNGAI
jgi:hypothetical protein